ncbi:P-loop containing nucleoside triphosphate hydrolase protein [Cyathus striatus]|nr:P-loop containing nucleoside triphosphate hydrolase protein [Cyathus striatus]
MPSKPKNWKRKRATVKKQDNVVEDGKPTDLVIAVMGPTGVGKSTFINALFGKDVTKVGHELKSCTSSLKHLICALPTDPSRRLVVVDTPGFDDTFVDDAEILRRISVWLAVSYTKDMKLAGVIYLHEISQTRMLGTTRKNLEMFHKLCGDDALSSVVLGTTKWSEVAQDVGDKRVKQLRDNFWKDMIEKGSDVFKFEKTNQSAWNMVNHLLQKHKDVESLRLQKELVDLQKIIPDTDAGKELRYSLEELLKMQKDKATEEQLQKTKAALQALKVSISERLMILLHLGCTTRSNEITMWAK